MVVQQLQKKMFGAHYFWLPLLILNRRNEMALLKLNPIELVLACVGAVLMAGFFNGNWLSLILGLLAIIFALIFIVGLIRFIWKPFG
jgi:1,4-dihydroxy-2-naphthoate octaprenyltransferase